jgi:hypothetical protein
LYLNHSGSKGQAFEWSVHEAINDPRRTEVRELVAAAMKACGVGASDPRSTLFAQEKFANEEFLAALVATLGDDARLRLYRRSGRPFNLMPLVREIQERGIHGLSGPLAMLPRADLLLSDKEAPAFVAASCKHNPRDVDDWPGVPIWITAESFTSRRRPALVDEPDRGRVIVTLPVDGLFIYCFEAAEAILLRVCAELAHRSTRGLAMPGPGQAKIARHLGELADMPVIDVSDWCDRRAQPALIAVGMNDSVQVPAPSWLTSVRRYLFGLSEAPSPHRVVDVPKPLAV